MPNYSNPNIMLIIFGIIAIILEIVVGAATGFELLVLGVIMVLGGGAGFLANSFTVAIIAVIVLLFAYVFFARNFIKKSLNITTHKTNADSIVGKQAVVVESIGEDKAGQIKIDGEIWRAISEKPIEKGKKVTIKSISGVTVNVEIVG